MRFWCLREQKLFDSCLQTRFKGVSNCGCSGVRVDEVPDREWDRSGAPRRKSDDSGAERFIVRIMMSEILQWIYSVQLSKSKASAAVVDEAVLEFYPLEIRPRPR